MNIELRDYQRDMLSRLQEAWKHHRSVMVQMPTGTGKTVLIPPLIPPKEGNGDSSQGRVLIVAHRRELVEQIKATLEKNGIPADGGNVWVESIQKLSRESQKPALTSSSLLWGEDGRGVSLVIIDEAHHALAKTYRQLWERWPDAKFLGLTATPCRLSGEPFTALFDVMLQSWPIQEFIDKGWLSDFEYVSAAPDSKALRQVRGLKKRGADGDYQQKEMVTVMDVPESIEHLYNTYKAFADGKKGIVYAIDRQHAQHIAEYYIKKGVSCAVIDSKTLAKERLQAVENYRRQALDVLVNVDIFGEGFDVPEVEFIQLARPTLSLSKYLQQVGRGMRVSEGKPHVLILDNVGLYQTFGLPTDERDWLQMFLGRQSGKGSEKGAQQPVFIREGENEKMLVNLEMVRIKRRGERHDGLEVFMQEGKYGVMKDGHVTCRPEFEHISRSDDGPFYAIATYPYAVFRNKSTVIALSGQDMRVALYGKVAFRGDLIAAEDIRGQRTYWDAVGGRYYDRHPVFEEIGGVEMARIGDLYLPRKDSRHITQPMAKRDIWYNDHLLWMGNVVILKRQGQIYPIAAFGTNQFFVRRGSTLQSDFWLIKFDGRMYPVTAFDYEWRYEKSKTPNWYKEQLVRASSGRLEYLDAQRERRMRQVIQ